LSKDEKDDPSMSQTSYTEIAKTTKERDRRTIEREIARGSVIQRDTQWRDTLQYCADAGQRVHDERACNKGRPLKIGHEKSGQKNLVFEASI
jgi:IS30 family transposase